MDIHTLEKNIVSEVRSEVDSVMTRLETKVQDAVLTAIKNLIFLRLQLAIKSVNASLLHGDGSVLWDRDQKDFSGKIEGLQMAGSSRINSHTDINLNDETRGNINVEGGDLLFNERNFDQQAHTHHIESPSILLQRNVC